MSNVILGSDEDLRGILNLVEFRCLFGGVGVRWWGRSRGFEAALEDALLDAPQDNEPVQALDICGRNRNAHDQALRELIKRANVAWHGTSSPNVKGATVTRGVCNGEG